MKRLMWIIVLLTAAFIAFSFFELRHLLFGLIVLVLLIFLGIYDTLQTKHAVLRNFPVIGHFRYILEFIRPEIQQYFIASDQSERPFSREIRNLVYQRAKGVRDTTSFGTQHDIDRPGYTYARHSLRPAIFDKNELRIRIGSDQCNQPYVASRLNISGMSYGALSKNAVIALNTGAKLGNFAHNTGEGGLTPYHLAGGGDIIMQLGTAYFGCRTASGMLDEALFIEKAHLPTVKMIEIKLSQGAKPSHGGVLPAAKITEEIAKIRHIPLNQDCVSPPIHPEFSTPEGLLHFVARLRKLSDGKPIGLKLCLGVRSEFLSICKAMLKTGIVPDYISIDGAEGGTGAAPVEFVNNIGEPLNDALIFIHNALVGVGLRDQIRLIASGKIATGLDMITKFALGADLCNSARAMMFALGCIQAMQCNANTCPTGVTTQNPFLYRGLVIKDKSVRVANFHKALLESCVDLAQAIGVAYLNDLAPHHIALRVAAAKTKTYAELYTHLTPRQLLGNEIPEFIAEDWQLASAERF